MPQSVINQVEDMSIKEDRDEDLILTERNMITLEVYDNDVNKHDVIAGVDNKYNNYNSNNEAYKDGTNDKEDSAIYEDGKGINNTHEDGVRYTPTPVTENPPGN